MIRIKADRELTEVEKSIVDYLARRGFSVTLNKCTPSFAIFIAERDGYTKAFRVRKSDDYYETADRLSEFALTFPKAE